MIIINFSHPLSAPQLEQVQKISYQQVNRLVEIPVDFYFNQPFTDQLLDLLEKPPLNDMNFAEHPMLVVLPSLNHIAGLVLAAIHGRTGHFPSILRLRPVPGSNPLVYEVAEIINLQEIRDNSRRDRYRSER